nr:MAG TPA: Fe-S metabolism associated domain [Caudoviricetes sp.]
MKEKIDALKETFLLLPEWADCYNYFVELGESLPAMPVAFQVPENRIACSSMLYFYVCHIQDLCYIFASANAAIPAGLAAMLFNLCDGVPRKDIRDNMPYLLATLKELGLIDNLTLSRRVALLTMVEKITNS